jgi:hypothetical protein
MNFLRATVIQGHGVSLFMDVAPIGTVAKQLKDYEGKEVCVGVRPENSLLGTTETSNFSKIGRTYWGRNSGNWFCR